MGPRVTFRSVSATLVVCSSLVGAPRASAAVAYNGPGFDTCSAPSIATMTAWLASPYRSIGIYIGGANRACGDGNLSASWVSTVEDEGWKLAPLYVGLQSPCVDQGGLQTIDTGSAAAEGISAAYDAVSRAAGFGLGPGTPIYFDMEAYGSSGPCINAVQSFVNAWTAGLHSLGYVAGVYGSSASTIHNEAFAPSCYPNRPDDIWFANWNGTPNIFGDPYFPDADWSSHQRLHQYLGGNLQTYGNVTINIDKDFDDGALAGAGTSGPVRRLTRSGGGDLTPGQLASCLSWVPWSAAGPPPSAAVASAPSLASWAPGRLDLFVRGGNGLLWHEGSVDGGRSFLGWEALGSPPGGMIGNPAAVSWGPGRIDVFVEGADHALWHTCWTGAYWCGWESRGGYLTSSPAVSSWGPGRLDIFALGGDHAMWHAWWTGQLWSLGFESLSGSSLVSPAAVSWGPNRIDVFTVTPDGLAWHLIWNGVQWGWLQDVPGHWASSLAASSWGAGRIDVFGQASPSGPMQHSYLAGAWFTDSEGGYLASAPTAVSDGYPLIDAFAQGLDGNLWHTWSGP